MENRIRMGRCSWREAGKVGICFGGRIDGFDRRWKMILVFSVDDDVFY